MFLISLNTMFLKGLFLCKSGILLDKKRKFCLKILKYIYKYTHLKTGIYKLLHIKPLEECLLCRKWPIFTATVFVVVMIITIIIYVIVIF